MDVAAWEELGAEVRADCAERRHDAAAARVIRVAGPEILGFLAARLRNEAAAGEVFSTFCEDLWRGLPGFAWRSTLRGWSYTLARHAAIRYARAERRRTSRITELTEDTPASRLAAEVRSSTQAHLKSAAKSRLRELRERLPLEDQTLLILRVDKGLAWRDLASVMADESVCLDEAELEREAARLRKRFQLVKDKLRRDAEREGLVPERARSG